MEYFIYDGISLYGVAGPDHVHTSLVFPGAMILRGTLCFHVAWRPRQGCTDKSHTFKINFKIFRVRLKLRNSFIPTGH